MSVSITKITDDFSTAPQISANDLAEIAQLGFKTIINNRPDQEGGAEQPMSMQLKQAAEKLGLHYMHIPVIPNQIQQSQIDTFRIAFEAAAKPVLGFCRTGNRAGNLFKLSQPNQASQSTAPKGLVAWLKSKCLITRLWRWYAPKCPLIAFCRANQNK
jgi:sulfide:quinone oxidoreductase